MAEIARRLDDFIGVVDDVIDELSLEFNTRRSLRDDIVAIEKERQGRADRQAAEIVAVSLSVDEYIGRFRRYHAQFVIPYLWTI